MKTAIALALLFALPAGVAAAQGNPPAADAQPAPPAAAQPASPPPAAAPAAPTPAAQPAPAAPAEGAAPPAPPAPAAEAPAAPAPRPMQPDGNRDVVEQLAIIVASAEDCGVDDVDKLLESNREALVQGDALGGLLAFSDRVTPIKDKVGQMEDTVLELHCQQVNGFVDSVRGDQ